MVLDQSFRTNEAAPELHVHRMGTSGYIEGSQWMSFKADGFRKSNILRKMRMDLPLPYFFVNTKSHAGSMHSTLISARLERASSYTKVHGI